MKELLGYELSPLREGDIALYRGSGNGLAPILLAAAQETSLGCVERLQHEYGLRSELDADWAARPVALTHDHGRMTLVLEDPGGTPLDRLLGRPLETSHFLRIAIPLAVALRQMHERGLIHKDIKPANILVDAAGGGVWLTGFGIASRLPREQLAPAAPEVIAGTLAYMAPEQTGRMNRSVDSRSDLYALGVTFYEMLTGMLPFNAADPMGWVHCHVARKPVPPDERVAGIPEPLSAIVMRLLAKTAEERYQAVVGVEADLRRALAQWDSRGRIDPFLLGASDVSDRLRIPEKLYGRERDIDTLLACFERVVASGTLELVLVSGYAGIGKSSLVNELHQALVSPRGLFVSGKFDQFKRDIPYATLGQAFQGLVRSLLTQSEAELARWRESLGEALGPNGQLIINLVPELELVIGKQPAVPDLPPQDAQNRFQMVFRRFLGVFARPEHPLALFLDDLQWLDAATLDLLEHLATHTEVRHLLLVGAYRTNEIGPSHPLLRTFDAIRKAGAPVQEINLAPLAREDLDRLVADTLSCGQGRAARLAQMVREKTGGNPFFVIQFISALAEEGLLRFDHEAARWHWELDRVHAKGYTDNVVDLMVGKLTRLPVETQEALQQLACLGNVAETTMLSIVLGKSNEEIDSDLWEAVRLELVKPSDGSYRFTHDRVQEAAYSLTPNQLRAEAHLLIGRLLALHTPAEKREEAVFEIVSQLNRGAALITSPDERQQLGELNLLAGRRARATTAYASALTYLTAGAALLPEDSWERGRELRFALELHRAECEFLTGALAEAEQRLAALSTRAATTVERATVACLRVDLYTTLDQSSRAIAVGLDYLRHLGMEWSPHPTEAEARHEYQRIWPQLESRPIEALIELSLMTDPASLATLEVLIKIGPAAFYTDANLLALVTCRAVNLSLERGNCDASCVAYAYLGIIAGPRFGDYQAGYRFGRLGYDLVERRGLTRFQARIYMDFGNVVLPWTRHVREGRELVRRAFEVANKVGDLTYAAYCGNELNTNLLAAGDPLAEVEREARRGLEFATNAKFGFVVDCIATQLGLIRTLRGLTPTFGCFDDEQFDEHLIERRFADNPDLAFVECWYWVRKLQGRFFAGDHVSAIEASSRAQRLLWTSPSYFEKAEYQFYTALSQAALCDAAPAQQRQQLLDALTDHHRQLTLWATNCPDNFANRAALVGAEIARIDGRDVDAMQLYEQAIQSAHAHGFVHNEGLADELAARYYAARGFRKISETYLKDARDCYLRWGAEGKVRQLDQQHPHLRPAPPPLTPTTTLDAPVEQLDVGTMLKASQALSGEIVFATLIQTLMRIAVEHAGAERGILFLLRKGEPQIAAEAATNRGEVEVALREKLVLRPEFPESAAHYVVRTRNKLIVEDALVSPLLSNDEYVRRRQSRSVLCLPIVKQAELVGVLLLENNLAPGVFTPDRITVLELLASQAAISLENAYLYSDLKRSESFLAEGQRMSRTGSWSWNLATGKVTWSEEHFRIFGHTVREQPEPTFEWFLERIHPEDRPFLEHRLAMAVRQSREFALDFRIVLPDRSTKHVHGVGRPIVEESGAVNEYIGTTIDVSERKRSEDELRKAQADLARVTRLTTMGELAASIAHEVNQPLMAIVNNAESCLIRLATEQPDLDKARKAAERIVKNGHRASDILRSIRAMVGKSSPEMTSLDINGVIENILDLMRAELHQHDVLLETELFTGLEPVSGDRVQLQQVILNLVKNGIEATSEIRDRQRMLRVVTRPDADGNVLTAVEDSGIGFDPAKIDRIFEPLFTTKREGMGMGLSICRSIIEAHGGRLRATPRLPFGSIFQFTLPPTQRGFN